MTITHTTAYLSPSDCALLCWRASRAIRSADQVNADIARKTLGHIAQYSASDAVARYAARPLVSPEPRA